MAFVDDLKTEVERLESELARHPAFMRLQVAKKLLATYTASDDSHSAGRAANNTMVETITRPVRRSSGASSSILATAKDLIAGRTHPTPTVEILEALAVQGLKVGGRIPRNSLSSMLSRSDEFKAHGRSGWTLVVPGENDGDDKELADDAVPSPETSSAYLERWSDQPAEPPAQGREAAPGGGT